MQFYSPRKLMFKVWDKDARLLVRPDNIPCVKGELKKKDHVFLQFTGYYDLQEEELYEMDIVFKGAEKFMIQWNANHTGWCLTYVSSEVVIEILTAKTAQGIRRLCSYFESADVSS